ncbi:hypothetical protein [Clostridium sp.]|uniref:hypothetical protein n=1 Tax=Clostridium sp. TaxID=1506 RepID=UPI003D6CCC3E
MDKEWLKRILKTNRKEQFFYEEGISEICEHTQLNKEQLMHTALFLVIAFWDKIEKQKVEMKKLNKDKGLLVAEYEILNDSKEELKVTIREQRMEIKDLEANKELPGKIEYLEGEKDSYMDYLMLVKENAIDSLSTKVRRLGIKNDMLKESRDELMTELRKQGIEKEKLRQQLKNMEADNTFLNNNKNVTDNELRLNRMSAGKAAAYKDTAPIEVILAYKKQGYTNEEIGGMLKVSRHTIGRRLKENKSI